VSASPAAVCTTCGGSLLLWPTDQASPCFYGHPVDQDRRVTRSAATGVRRYHRGAPCVCGHTVEQHLSAAARCDVQDAVCGCMRFRLDDDR